MRKVPRGHTFPFEGTKVSVASSILKKWAEIPTDEKLRSLMPHTRKSLSAIERNLRTWLKRRGSGSVLSLGV